jgi:hypothetical protein
LLRAAYRVRLAAQWRTATTNLMIALHARRSAASISAWRAQRPQRPLVLVLTGTDLYRDIDSDADARVRWPGRPAGGAQQPRARRLPAPLRVRCQWVLQSCPARQPLPQDPAATCAR